MAEKDSRHGQRGDWRRGALGGLITALVLLVSLPLSGPSGSGYVWNLAMGSGAAGLIMLSVIAWTSEIPASASLPAPFFHAGHVYTARIATAFALIHTVVLLVEEPAVLADLRPGGPYSMVAGCAALTLMALLATTPSRHCRRLHARRWAGKGHVGLAALAAGLTLAHLLAVDYATVGWRRGVWSLLLAAAVVAASGRRVWRPDGGKPVHQSGPTTARPLARRAAILSALMVAAAVLTYAAVRA